jgi:hypothetical protein
MARVSLLVTSCTLLALALSPVDSAPKEPLPSWELALAPPGEPGEPFVLEGRVLGGDGSRPIRDALVYAYHADDAGRYSIRGEDDARLGGMLRTNVLGGYRLRTVLPGMAEGNPHVHFIVQGPGNDYRMLTVNLCRRSGAGSDSAFARLPWMLTLPSGNWAYVQKDLRGIFRARWDLPFYRERSLEERPRVFDRHAPWGGADRRAR